MKSLPKRMILTLTGTLNYLPFLIMLTGQLLRRSDKSRMSAKSSGFRLQCLFYHLNVRVFPLPMSADFRQYLNILQYIKRDRCLEDSRKHIIGKKFTIPVISMDGQRTFLRIFLTLIRRKKIMTQTSYKKKQEFHMRIA